MVEDCGFEGRQGGGEAERYQVREIRKKEEEGVNPNISLVQSLICPCCSGGPK